MTFKELSHELHSINSLQPPKACRVFVKCGSSPNGPFATMAWGSHCAGGYNEASALMAVKRCHWHKRANDLWVVF